MPIVSGGGGASGPSSPGFEIGYDQITAAVTISSNVVAGTTIISCAAHTFDGAPVLATFFASQIGAGDVIVVRLFEAAVNLGRLLQIGSAIGEGGAMGMLRFTPTAGSHTYTVTGQRTAVNGTVQAGVPVGDDFTPSFIRFTKV